MKVLNSLIPRIDSLELFKPGEEVCEPDNLTNVWLSEEVDIKPNNGPGQIRQRRFIHIPQKVLQKSHDGSVKNPFLDVYIDDKDLDSMFLSKFPGIDFSRPIYDIMCNMYENKGETDFLTSHLYGNEIGSSITKPPLMVRIDDFESNIACLEGKIKLSRDYSGFTLTKTESDQSCLINVTIGSIPSRLFPSHKRDLDEIKKEAKVFYSQDSHSQELIAKYSKYGIPRQSEISKSIPLTNDAVWKAYGFHFGCLVTTESVNKNLDEFFDSNLKEGSEYTKAFSTYIENRLGFKVPFVLITYNFVNSGDTKNAGKISSMMSRFPTGEYRLNETKIILPILYGLNSVFGDEQKLLKTVKYIHEDFPLMPSYRSAMFPDLLENPSRFLVYINKEDNYDITHLGSGLEGDISSDILKTCSEPYITMDLNEYDHTGFPLIRHITFSNKSEKSVRTVVTCIAIRPSYLMGHGFTIYDNGVYARNLYNGAYARNLISGGLAPSIDCFLELSDTFLHEYGIRILTGIERRYWPHKALYDHLNFFPGLRLFGNIKYDHVLFDLNLYKLSHVNKLLTPSDRRKLAHNPVVGYKNSAHYESDVLRLNERDKELPLYQSLTSLIYKNLKSSNNTKTLWDMSAEEINVMISSLSFIELYLYGSFMRYFEKSYEERVRGLVSWNQLEGGFRMEDGTNINKGTAYIYYSSFVNRCLDLFMQRSYRFISWGLKDRKELLLKLLMGNLRRINAETGLEIGYNAYTCWNILWKKHSGYRDYNLIPISYNDATKSLINKEKLESLIN